MTNQLTKQVQKKIKKLSLKQSESVVSQKKKNNKYYKTEAIDSEKNKVFFKASLIDDKNTIESLGNEVYILKQISTLKNNHQSMLPKLISSKVGKKSVWLLREFIEGKNFGDWQTGFNEEILKNLPLAKKLAIKIYYLQIHLISTSDDKKLNTRKLKDVLKKIKELSNSLLKNKIITTKQIEKIEKKISNLKIQESLLFCHGNLEPKNILYNKANIGIINWKNAIISNPAMDIAQIWIYALQNEKWQNHFIDSYLEFSSNQTIVKQYLEIEKIYQILNILNKFNQKTRIKSIKNSKKKFFNNLKKTLNKLI